MASDAARKRTRRFPSQAAARCEQSSGSCFPLNPLRQQVSPGNITKAMMKVNQIAIRVISGHSRCAPSLGRGSKKTKPADIWANSTDGRFTRLCAIRFAKSSLRAWRRTQTVPLQFGRSARPAGGSARRVGRRAGRALPEAKAWGSTCRGAIERGVRLARRTAAIAARPMDSSTERRGPR